MKNKFIEQVTAQIKNKKARAQIEQELGKSHTRQNRLLY